MPICRPPGWSTITKPIVSDMTRYNILRCLLLLSLSLPAQIKQEQEIRIDREMFPDRSLELLEGHLQGVRKLRFYQEIENGEMSYEAKFKKGRLHDSVEVLENGELEHVEPSVKKQYSHNDGWDAIQGHLDVHYP